MLRVGPIRVPRWLCSILVPAAMGALLTGCSSPSTPDQTPAASSSAATQSVPATVSAQAPAKTPDPSGPSTTPVTPRPVDADISVFAGPGGADLYPQVGSTGRESAGPIVCTVYGRAPGTKDTAIVWDYTRAGWVEDRLLRAPGTAPAADGCYGDIRHPTLDDVFSRPADPRIGPFPIRTVGGHGTGLYTTPDGDGVSKGTVPEGALVRLTCARKGVTIYGPDGPTQDWDRVVDLDVYGWVSDADVLTIQGYYPPPAKPGPADQLMPCWQ